MGNVHELHAVLDQGDDVVEGQREVPHVHAQAVLRCGDGGGRRYQGEDGGEDGQDVVGKELAGDVGAGEDSQAHDQTDQHHEGDVDLPYHGRQAGLVIEIVLGELLSTRDDISDVSLCVAEHGSCRVPTRKRVAVVDMA